MPEAPALYLHCHRVYEEMAKRAKTIVLPDSKEEATIYEGMLTKMFEDLDLSVPYYTSVMNMLKEMDCVRQLRRGGGGSKSQWLIVQAPSRQLFEHARAKAKSEKDTFEKRMTQMLNDLNSRLGKLEQIVFASVMPTAVIDGTGTDG